MTSGTEARQGQLRGLAGAPHLQPVQPTPGFLSKGQIARLEAMVPRHVWPVLRAHIQCGYTSGDCFASMDALCQLARVSSPTLTRTRAWLVEHGFLVQTARPARKRKRGTAHYRVVPPDEVAPPEPTPSSDTPDYVQARLDLAAWRAQHGSK
jgi:hypothetical protein